MKKKCYFSNTANIILFYFYSIAAVQRDQMDDFLGGKLGPLKSALSHIGLYVGIVCFTAAGAKVSNCLCFINATFIIGSRNLEISCDA